MKPGRKFTLHEVSLTIGLPDERLTQWIAREWIVPADANHCALDEEDVARARLIHELCRDFGANDEAIPLILHLIDQLHCLRARIRQLA